MKISFKLGALLAAVGITVTAGAFAQNSKDGYLQDGRGVIVRNSNFGDPKIGNLCWRTGYWTPAMANCECDAPIVGAACNPPAPKPAAAPAPAPAPAAAPAPKPAAPAAPAKSEAKAAPAAKSDAKAPAKSDKSTKKSSKKKSKKTTTQKPS